jgi:esterase/lipase/1-acyl-sn-glycerol-3-phosphate acyltransferase
MQAIVNILKKDPETMNRFAYEMAGFAIKTLEGLSKARIYIHGKENIPDGAVIFVINHFTRIETLFLPYHIYNLTNNVPVWSLADYSLFKGSFGDLLDKLGAVSTRNPDRDLLVVKTLLTGEASWIIFPEGMMVKDKKIIEKGKFMLSYAGGKHPPHTGAATLALRTEFYRQRLKKMADIMPDEAKRTADMFGIDAIESVFERKTHIVPVNATYYPIRGYENALNRIAEYIIEKIPDRITEEIMTEGTMLLAGVDIDIRFGDAIDVGEYTKNYFIKRDIGQRKAINFDDQIPSKRFMKNAALSIMQRYMNSIYSMTTVNHDHLFASILMKMPFREMEEDDLKRRVFLVSTLDLKNAGCFIHKSLMDDQVSLLTDDRYNKFGDFMDVAERKGIVARKNGHIVKDALRIAFPFDFHRVRIENPVAVMANELEPLAGLQKRIRLISFQPGFRIKQRVSEYLIDRALREFEEDYKKFLIAGESKKTEVGMPYILKGKSAELGVLLVHGYMAAPLEMRELAEHLSRMGLWVYVPRVRGHGTSPEDLAGRKYEEWIKSVEDGYACLSAVCGRVAAGGFSNGAGLALELASRIKKISGVFAICPPLKLKDFSSRLVPAVDAWNRLMGKFGKDGAKKEFVQNKPENPHINYSRNPVSGVRELERFMDSVEPKLSSVKAPALVIQAHDDPVVSPKGSRKVYEHIGSVNKSYLVFNFNRHVIITGEGAHLVHKAVGDFVVSLKS